MKTEKNGSDKIKEFSWSHYMILTALSAVYSNIFGNAD